MPVIKHGFTESYPAVIMDLCGHTLDLCGLKEAIELDDYITDLQIENFSLEDSIVQEKTFIPKIFNGLYAFSVSIFSNGSSPKNAGYVSLVVKSSMTENRDLTAMASSNSMTCTASVIDVNGEGRYSQSFGMETIVFIDCYVPGLEKFIKRSTLLSQKEEILYKDVLTMRFEFSFRTNHELDALQKVSEFLPSVFADPSNLNASGMANSVLLDFLDIFKDFDGTIDLQSNVTKSFDNNTIPKKLDSPIQASNSRTVVTDASRSFDSELYKKNEGTKAVITEMQTETKDQILDDISSKDSAILKNNTEETPGFEAINKEQTNPIPRNQKYLENDAQISRSETKTLINILGDNNSDESNNSAVAGEYCKEMNPSESTEQKLSQLFQTGDDTAKNVVIAVNGHRIFRKSNQSHKNEVDFDLTTDEELYKLFYSTESLRDDESKSIYRMHGSVLFFTNLMERDESAFLPVVKNEEVSLQKNPEGQIDSFTSSKETCSDQNIRSDNNKDNGKLANFQNFSDKNVCISSPKFTFKSPVKHIQSDNLGDGNKSTTSEKHVDNLEKETINEESTNAEEKFNECKWNFLIQTADNVTIPVPFEENKETIGSKLLDASAVFSKMLMHPMKERSEGRVELSDVTSRTVNYLLSYIDNGKLSDIPLPDAYDLYEAADKYAVKNLMKACADFMVFFPIRENVWSMVKLAELHSDDYLLELSERVQKIILRLEQISMKNKNKLLDMLKDLVKEVEVSSETMPTQSDFFAQDFNFYQ